MPTWPIVQFNGGLSTGSKIGVPGSFYSGHNLDIYSDPDELQVQAKTVKDSSSVVTDLVKFFCSDGSDNDLFALGDTGKFYKREYSTGTWTALRTLGGGNSQGLGYFNDLIYFVSGNKLGTYNVGTGAFNESYQSLDTADWHPLVNFLDKIIIGDGQYISTVDGSGIWQKSLLTLDNDYRVTSLEVISNGNWLAIGTEKTDKSDCKIFLWDGFSKRYNDSILIKEHKVNAIVESNGVVLVSAGAVGNLYEYTGTGKMKVKNLKFVSKGSTVRIWPGAAVNYRDIPLFAVSEGNSTTVHRGIYSWGRTEKNYPTVLNLDYLISTGTYTGTGVQIGALYAEGENDLYVGWKDGSSYGVDKIDGSGVFSTAEYRSRVFDAQNPHLTKLFTDFKMVLSRPLRTGETITITADKNRTGTFSEAIGVIDFASDGAITDASFDVKIRASRIQLKVVITCASTSPGIEAMLGKFSIEGKW